VAEEEQRGAAEEDDERRVPRRAPVPDGAVQDEQPSEQEYVDERRQEDDEDERRRPPARHDEARGDGERRDRELGRNGTCERGAGREPEGQHDRAVPLHQPEIVRQAHRGERDQRKRIPSAGREVAPVVQPGDLGEVVERPRTA